MSADGDPDSVYDYAQLLWFETAGHLHHHLTKALRRTSSSDNFVSWTSSLLLAIQYVIYRCHQSGQASRKVEICVADPEEFPADQFMRVLSLAEACEAHANGGADGFFNLCLTRSEFDEGEYLGQGRVEIADRSCVFTLAQLEQTGLYELYPELAGAEVERWLDELRAQSACTLVLCMLGQTGRHCDGVEARDRVLSSLRRA